MPLQQRGPVPLLGTLGPWNYKGDEVAEVSAFGYGLRLPSQWLTKSDAIPYAHSMRDRETIDSELRLLVAGRRSIREHGGEPSSRQVDELLDERLGHRAEASETEAVEACETEVVADTWSQHDETVDITPYGRKGVLRRFGLLAALPLSLVAIATVLVVMFAVHNPHPAAQPTVIPPSGARPNPAAPVVPPSGVPPNQAAPKAPAPQLDIVDRAFIDVLKQEGVPVPSHEYVLIHGHAVCEFLAHQPNFAEAVHFVQRSSIWDANQSADFTTGAIVSYCPQYEPASPDQMPQAFQNALSDLQTIQGDLQGIRDDLQAIPGRQ
ncbi:MAG: hypothetical protein QOG75_681 [Mycobacterium sp.]|nr:hypothetical protein [Mycobacterium sp.]